MNYAVLERQEKATTYHGMTHEKHGQVWMCFYYVPQPPLNVRELLAEGRLAIRALRTPVRRVHRGLAEAPLVEGEDSNSSPSVLFMNRLVSGDVLSEPVDEQEDGSGSSGRIGSGVELHSVTAREPCFGVGGRSTLILHHRDAAMGLSRGSYREVR